MTQAKSLAPPLIALVAISGALLGARFYAAGQIGFGDSEALYASYALHPQPAYLDHPGLIGQLARALSGGAGSPSPGVAHTVTAVLATLVPWTLALSARAAGASWRAALLSAVAVALVPEIAVGLYAMTPDLLVAFAWIGALGLACAGLRAPASSVRAAAALVGAGLLAGIASASKVSGLALMIALGVAYASRPARAHGRTIWPWAGLVAGAIALAPIVAYEARAGWPMIKHRFIDAQHGAWWPSLESLGKVSIGQLVYVSPLFIVAAVMVARDLWRAQREADGAGRAARPEGSAAAERALLLAFAVPLAVLGALSVWSRAAEPHWIAPALLALPIHSARREHAMFRAPFALGAMITGGVLVVAVHAWVLVPSLLELAPRSYDARVDISNELYGWPDVVAGVRQTAMDEATPLYQKGDIVVVGPHWVVCAQLHAALRDELPVGCATPVTDDFDDWYPRGVWMKAETLLFVSDARFTEDPSMLFPDHVIKRRRVLTVRRGSLWTRVFTLTVLERRGEG